MSYSEWEAAIAAGATLEDLQKWDQGQFPRAFKIKVMAWHVLHALVEANQNDASEDKRQRDNKLRK